MKIIDTYDSIYSSYKHNVFDIELWEKYADEISSELKNKVKKDSKRNDFEKQTLPVLNNLKLQKMHTPHFLSLRKILKKKYFKNSM